jgi:hypothetical protein
MATSKYHLEYKAEFNTCPTNRFGLALKNKVCSQGKFLVNKVEFGGSFGMSLERDCNKVEVTSNLEFFYLFWYELGGSSS